MSVPSGVCTHHGIFYCSLPGGVRAHPGLFRAHAFETPASFEIVAKKPLDSAVVHVQANQKTSPLALSKNIDVTPSMHMRLHIGEQ